MRTVTIIAAFREGRIEELARTNLRLRKGPSSCQTETASDYAGGHWQAVSDFAGDLSSWLHEQGYADLGFTAVPSFGGGAGWETETGFVLTFANVPEHWLTLAPAVAEWIRARESQQAVCILTREESFTLHTV